MVQFNLLPDVKLQWLKARRIKRLVSFIAIVAAAACLLIFVLALVTVDVVQKKSLQSVTSDVVAKSTQLKNTPDINKMLTVQSQLSALTSLHSRKAVVSRLFGDLAKVTPTQVTISNLNIDFTANTLTLTGEAPSLDAINTYVDTLKATTYQAATDNNDTSAPPTLSAPAPAFSNVVLSSFGRDSSSATYTIMLSFDPQIFSNENDGATLSVPAGTISNTSQLFKKQAAN